VLADDQLERGSGSSAMSESLVGRVDAALTLAYRYLNRRERTVAETRIYLTRRGVDEDAAQGAIATLIEDAYLDDSRFAAAFAADKREFQDWGTERIRRDLLARGIEREQADAAVGCDPESSDLGRALALLRRRFPAAPLQRRDRDRALGVLLRKGYGCELALDALSAHARGEPA
jgi:regulatory protein